MNTLCQIRFGFGVEDLLRFGTLGGFWLRVWDTKFEEDVMKASDLSKITLAQVPIHM